WSTEDQSCLASSADWRGRGWGGRYSSPRGLNGGSARGGPDQRWGVRGGCGWGGRFSRGAGDEEGGEDGGGSGGCASEWEDGG
ncbi:hypothetical protein V498_10625, partial [Pseudogymnoascus sp. VKM F-4517 (FW-2822)]